MGCCQGSQKLRFSNRNMIPQNHASLPPPTGEYHLNYVPPIPNNTYVENNSVMINDNIGAYQFNKTGTLSDQFYQSNGFSNAVYELLYLGKLITTYFDSQMFQCLTLCQ